MATNPNKRVSPQLRAPWEGVPVIRISVFQMADSQPPTKRFNTLPAPPHAPRADGTFDRPQYIFGFRQTPGKAVITRGKKQVQVGPSAGFEVVSAKVNQTRFWSCSSATFTLAAPFDRYTPPMLPPVRPEDVVTIEIGYAPSLRVSLGNEGVWFMPVFYGIVDNVKDRGGSGDRDGVTLTISARDPLRYLVDNKIRGTYLKHPGNGRDNRGYTVMDLLWMGAQIDSVKWTKTVVAAQDAKIKAGQANSRGFGYTAKNGEVFATKDGYRVPETDGNGMVYPADYGPDNSYITLGVIEASRRENLPVLTDSENTMGPQGIAIMDRFPLDLIKHFSLVETSPRELFADPERGHVHWMFRRTDMRRLLGNTREDGDEWRMRRQFFYRLPENRANILAYTNEWTTAGTVSHFTITNGRANVDGQKGVNERYAESPMAQLADPHRPLNGYNYTTGGKFKETDGVYLRQFTRQRFVYDDTLAESDELTVLATALFTIWGKDIETGMLQILGDPTIEIGEAIQIFNTCLFGRRLYVDPKTGKFTEGGPPGIYRVEGVQHLYASGGVGKGYTTVLIFNNVDPPSKQIRNDDDARSIDQDKAEKGANGIWALPTDKREQS